MSKRNGRARTTTKRRTRGGRTPAGTAAALRLDIATRRRTQLTSLDEPLEGVVNGPRFVDTDTIVFSVDGDRAELLRFFTVKTRGPGLPGPMPRRSSTLRRS